nr:MAG TPA: hypothetical protein [Herelleviridae sp.]
MCRCGFAPHIVILVRTLFAKSHLCVITLSLL